MPEVCEVRVVADELREKLTGSSILSYHINEIFKGRTTGFNDNLIFPLLIKTVRSYGKKVIFELDDYVMIASLGMTGRFQYVEEKHSHVYFELNEEQKLYFEDSRRFGRIDIMTADKEKEYLSDLGPDLLQHALTTWITETEWSALYKPKLLKRKICDILLDQSILAGIGNYLVSEILYYAGVHPLRIGNTITAEELELIRIHAHKVVLCSYEHGGFTIESFISPSKRSGKYPAMVYGKYKDPNGYKVIHQKTSNAKGARTVHFVDELQK